MRISTKKLALIMIGIVCVYFTGLNMVTTPTDQRNASNSENVKESRILILSNQKDSENDGGEGASSNSMLETISGEFTESNPIKAEKTVDSERGSENNPSELCQSRSSVVSRARELLDSMPLLQGDPNAPQPYPLTRALIEMAVAPNTTGLQIDHVTDKLARGADVHLSILGGSFSRGVGCDDGGDVDFACSYASRTQRWMAKAFPKNNIFLSDLTRQGSTSGVFVSGLAALVKSLGDQVPDIIFVDTLGESTSTRVLAFSGCIVSICTLD